MSEWFGSPRSKRLGTDLLPTGQEGYLLMNLTQKTNRKPLFTTLCLLAGSFFATGEFSSSLEAQAIHRENGQVRVEPYPIDARWLNPWPSVKEDAFWERANAIIQEHARDGSFGNKHFENEKAAYPNAFMALLAGFDESAIRFLQAEDTQAGSWHQHTEGIDYYAAFTLKGQMRKYFFFGPQLDQAYRERMFRGAKAWTATDPRTTPHPVFQRYNPNLQGWTPERFGNRQVDGRRTDNLFAMSTTSTFLMAEETGNEETMETYRDMINRYVWSLYHIGMGEWDSATYHGHTIAAYLNLFDFVKDEQIKGVSKAALDQLFTMMAFKYYRGGMVRPTKRDNNFHNGVLTNDFTKFAWLYFGELEVETPPHEHDHTHAILSGYRPPRAVMALARKDFDRPVEVLSSKINYQNWEQDADDSHRPRHFETMFFGANYQMGSITPRGPENDVAPFNLVVENQLGSVDYFVAGTSERDNLPRLGIDSGVQIAQYRNHLIWLRDGDQGDNFFFQVPEGIEKSTQDGVWFFGFDDTWLAVWPINLKDYETREVTGRTARSVPGVKGLVAAKESGPFYGFALEVGDRATHGDFAAFQKAVLEQSVLNLERLSEGFVRLTGVAGEYIELGFPVEGMAHVDRNGHVRDFDDPSEWDLLRTVGDQNLVSLGWKEGVLEVEAGGHFFRSTMTRDGETSFSDQRP